MRSWMTPRTQGAQTLLAPAKPRSMNPTVPSPRGQLGLPPSEDMEDGQPPAAAAPRPLRIKKKPKPPGLLAPAGATEATANSDARPPGASTLRKHVWQNVDIVRADLANSFRPRSTEEDVDAVRYFQPTDRRRPRQRDPPNVDPPNVDPFPNSPKLGPWCSTM